ncbi:hypothetical protein NIES2119_17305 [[Phormidium ambiguum] IAM M-71]|uniref:Uncharacterized protein n=1 Tax=[Phormidium ambiguum] IAM M-71 TaxID=454136 RepID=A0A1U7IH09_9CYAN|nr:hypothetical protein [Phormidium ambiguum]OKH36399.1 hypothetical protein NIES2119_17305 [Phormidium ambiguum IAM M-71]
MKHFTHQFTTNSTVKGRIFSAFVLAAILSLGANFSLINSAVAYPESNEPITSQIVNSSSSLVSQNQSDRSTNTLPNSIANAVKKDLSKRTGIAPGKLKVVNSQQETWPNGCLGISEPDQICTQALVPGWRITVTDGQKNWVYRTDNSGRNIRLETQTVSVNSPKTLQLVSNETLIAATPKPSLIPRSELPPALDRGVMFQAITSGGFAGRTYQTTLMNDGLLMRVRIGDANDSERSVQKISPQQMRQFQRLLQRQPLSQYNGLSYPASSGAADYITVTLISSSGTVRYADIVQSELPKSLREVIQAWNKIISSRN